MAYPSTEHGILQNKTLNTTVQTCITQVLNMSFERDYTWNIPVLNMEYSYINIENSTINKEYSNTET